MFLEKDEFSTVFNTIMTLNGLWETPCQEESEAFFQLQKLLLQKNEFLNLTAIRDPRAVPLLHFADSLTALPFLPQNARVADVGCGAGFPSLPLAIARRDLSVTSVDSTAKKLAFVAEAAGSLGLSNVKTVVGRAEELGKGALRGSFDAVTARAVAALPVLCELCLPLARVGGVFLAMKGAKGEEELADAESAIEKLGGKVEEVRRVSLSSPDVDGGAPQARILILIRKVRPTPAQYPRIYTQIAKKPL